jgi:site-specific DNA-methyltransferase (adenine-specific)
MSVHFLSQSVDWATPDGVYDELDREFHFDTDPCILGGGVMWSDGKFSYIDKTANGLEIEWGGATFVNPPYGRAIGAWTAKALAESKRGKTVVMLIPSRTDTIWWHRDIMQANEIRFIKGRLKFGDSVNSAPFPSAVVVFRAISGEVGE